ncbi:MAG: hypothetical protein NTY38_01795, partial [Acidobacteria bacterium]|nr:hypothetical protein [Acidobacteriota bacterium]
SGGSTAGLAGWWKLDETSGALAADSSGNGNGGTLQSGATWAAGKLGNAVNLDGSNGHIQGATAGNAFPVGNSPRTATAWVKTASTGGIDRGVLHYGTDGGSGAVNYHLVVRGDGTVAVGNGFGFSLVQTAAKVDNNAWHHIAGVYDGPPSNGARVYIDGTLQASGSLFPPDTGTGSAWRIGRFLNGTTPFQGLLDDVRLYTRALSVAEIQSVLSESGGSVSTPSIAAGVTGLDFGIATVGATSDKAVTLSNTGAGSLIVSSLTAGGRFSVVSPATPLTIAAGAQSGTLTIASNDAARPSVAVTLAGTGVAAGSREAALTPGWDDFSVPYSSGRVTWTTAPAAAGQLTFQAAFELRGSVANRRFTASVHFFIPGATTQTDISQFGGTKLSGRETLSREGVTASLLGAWDFGPLTTDAQGNATAFFSYTVPDRAYFMQFIVRAGDCVANGGSACSADFRTGQKFGTNFETIGGSTPSTPAAILFSDAFSRASKDMCNLGASDQRLGGTTAKYYVPLWPNTTARAQGATLVSNWLVNGGTDYGGVTFAAGPGGCSGQGGEDVGQDLDISMEVMVPTSGGRITQAGPFFRSRSAAPGDGIIGGTSAGYWVQLWSTGEVKVKKLNPQEIVASSAAPAGFDASAVHQLRTLIQGGTLTVWLDGRQVTTVAAGATTGFNDGAAGISFGCEPNRGQIGGQKIRNLVVTVPAH